MAETSTVGAARADKLYARVLSEYGDDSVAQLGGAHVACEGVSNIVTKVLEWGRLMAYLEQSTRYVPYTDRPNGRWKYHVPVELDRSPLRDTFVRTLDGAFGTKLSVVVDAAGDLRLAPESGGVDQGDLAAVDLDFGVDRVAGGSGDVGDDDPLVAEHPVDQRRLADVRPADHGDPDRFVLIGPRGSVTEVVDDAAVIDREETKWSTLIRSIGLKPE